MSNGDYSFLEGEEKDEEEDALGLITSQAQILIEKRKELALLEEQIKQLKKEEKVLSQEDIPTLMLEKGLTSVTLETGEKIEIMEDLFCTLPKTDMVKRHHVMTWIVLNGGEGMIKNELLIADPEVLVIDFLNKKGIPYDKKKDINAATLKAWFKSKLGMKKGTLQEIELGDIPKEANVFAFKKTKIK